MARLISTSASFSNFFQNPSQVRETYLRSMKHDFNHHTSELAKECNSSPGILALKSVKNSQSYLDTIFQLFDDDDMRHRDFVQSSSNKLKMAEEKCKKKKNKISSSSSSSFHHKKEDDFFLSQKSLFFGKNPNQQKSVFSSCLDDDDDDAELSEIFEKLSTSESEN